MQHKIGMSGFSMVSLLAFCALQAQASPRDLQDLKDRWDSVVKTDIASDVMKVDEVVIGKEEASYKRVKGDWVSQGGQDASVSGFSYQELKKGSREEVMKLLFPSKMKTQVFCKAIPTVTLKDDEEMTEAEKTEALARQNFLNCKRKVSDMLDGIFHADPYTLLLHVEHKGGGSEVIFYVRSLIESDQYLHYRFQRS